VRVILIIIIIIIIISPVLLTIGDQEQLTDRGDKSYSAFIENEALPLMDVLMNPCRQRNLKKLLDMHHYRSYYSCRIVENVFGILDSRFLIILNTINLSPGNASAVEPACPHLHIYLRRKERKTRPSSQYPCGSYAFIWHTEWKLESPSYIVNCNATAILIEPVRRSKKETSSFSLQQCSLCFMAGNLNL
jgi:hypothetical protein